MGCLLGQDALLDGPQAGLPPPAGQLPAEELRPVLLEPVRPRRLRLVLVLLSVRLRCLFGAGLPPALVGRRRRRRKLPPEAGHRPRPRQGARRRQRAPRLLGRHLAPRGRQQHVHPAGAEHVVGRQRRDLGPALLLLLVVVVVVVAKLLEHARVDDEVARVVHHELRHGHRLAERPHAAVRHHHLPAAARRRGTRDQVAHLALAQTQTPGGSCSIAQAAERTAEPHGQGRGGGIKTVGGSEEPSPGRIPGV
jgi:hypothetical protein